MFYNQHINFKNERGGRLVITGVGVTRLTTGYHLVYLTNGVMFAPTATKFFGLGEGAEVKDITIYH